MLANRFILRSRRSVLPGRLPFARRLSPAATTRLLDFQAKAGDATWVCKSDLLPAVDPASIETLLATDVSSDFVQPLRQFAATLLVPTEDAPSRSQRHAARSRNLPQTPALKTRVQTRSRATSVRVWEIASTLTRWMGFYPPS
jgi:hypothetical protein